MAAPKTDDPECKNGFIFLANQLCLDFLNTQLTQQEDPVEFLTDAGAVSRWLAAAGLVPPAAARAAAKQWALRHGGRSFMAKLWGFRGELREAVLAFEQGRKPKPAFVTELNRLLRQYPIRYELHVAGGQPKLRRRLDLDSPNAIYGPIADAAAALFVSDPARVRKCEACPGQFFDASKKGARRWCSMRRCGNKVKVATYTRRHARETAAGE